MNYANRIRRRYDCSGYTIIELLTSIAIVGLLLSLIVMGVDSARALARRTSCMNRIRQIGAAVISFDAAYGHFPSSGWSFDWVGDPRGGIGKNQPGGWIYSTSPFLVSTGINERSTTTDDERRKNILLWNSTSVPEFTCPSRHTSDKYEAERRPVNCGPLNTVAKSDYAINGGDVVPGGIGAGPTTFAQGISSKGYKWIDASENSGVSFQRSDIRTRDIRDGTSKTLLLGEKYISTANGGIDIGNDQSMYSGFDYDTVRWSRHSPRRDSEGRRPRQFGSNHRTGCGFAFCDGSAKVLRYDIDEELFRRLGSRRDRKYAAINDL
jgi:prepilin-type N-terminal cleavage/methylation domain-containing protein